MFDSSLKMSWEKPNGINMEQRRTERVGRTIPLNARRCQGKIRLLPASAHHRALGGSAGIGGAAFAFCGLLRLNFWPFDGVAGGVFVGVAVTIAVVGAAERGWGWE